MSDLKGQLRRSYLLSGQRVLVLAEGCTGGVEAGDTVQVRLPSGEQAQAKVVTVAWGSAFDAESPPVTLVVDGLTDVEPQPGADVSGVE